MNIQTQVEKEMRRTVLKYMYSISKKCENTAATAVTALRGTEDRRGFRIIYHMRPVMQARIAVLSTISSPLGPLPSMAK